MTKITFIRHGITDWNIEKRAQGHSNNPLNETGFKQAEALGDRMANANDHWDLLIASDLMRARQTAEIISGEINKPIAFFDTRLREISRGKIQGTIEEERIDKWGPDWRQMDMGIETKLAVQERGIDFVMDMVNRYPDKHLLVVSHGILIKQTIKGLLKLENLEGALENTSLTTIEEHMTEWSCTLFNCTAHLEEPKYECSKGKST